METPVTTWNVSEEERLHYVAEVQEETTKIMLLAMTFLIFLSALGIVGNTMVLIVYYKGFKKGSTRVLILFIAAVDLFSCLLVIPGEVYDMFHLWDWSNVGLCKARMFITGTSTVASALALLVVAAVRFRKVCYPFGWQVGSRHARICAILVLLFAMLASVPLGLVNGRQTKPLPSSFTPDMRSEDSLDLDNSTVDGIFGNVTEEVTSYDDVTASFSSMTTVSVAIKTGSSQHNDSVGLYGHECTTDDAYVGTIWPVVATGILLLLFIGSAIPLCTVYGLIGRKAWRHRKKFQVQHLGNSRSDSTTTGIGLRVFRMLSSRRQKHPQASSNGETTSSSNTNTTSCSGTSSAGGGKEESSNVAVSTISTGELSHSNDEFQSSSVEDLDSQRPTATAGENPGQDANACLVNTTTSEIPTVTKNNKKISKPDIKLPTSKDCSPNPPKRKSIDSKETKTQTRKKSQNPTEPSASTADGQNFVEINLASNRIAQSEDSSNSEDFSDTNEGRARRFVKTARKISQTSMFKTLIKRSESETTLGQRETNSSWHSKFKRRSTKEKKERPEVINRTTVMLFTISTIYIVGYLSHLSMIFFKLGAPATFRSLGFVGMALWNFFLRLYYVNCAANPVVYSLCDMNFRRNCFTLFKTK